MFFFVHSDAILQILTYLPLREVVIFYCTLHREIWDTQVPESVDMRNRNSFPQLLIQSTVHYLIVVFTWRIIWNFYTSSFLFLFVTALIFFCLSFLGRPIKKQEYYWHIMVTDCLTDRQQDTITGSTLLCKNTYSFCAVSFSSLSSPLLTGHTQSQSFPHNSEELQSRSISLLLQSTIPWST